VFDDSFGHEAWNKSDQTPVILMVDTWNPYLSEPERAAVETLVAAIGDFRVRCESMPPLATMWIRLGRRIFWRQHARQMRGQRLTDARIHRPQRDRGIFAFVANDADCNVHALPRCALDVIVAGDEYAAIARGPAIRRRQHSDYGIANRYVEFDEGIGGYPIVRVDCGAIDLQRQSARTFPVLRIGP